MVVCQMINYIIFQIFRCYYVVLIGWMNQWKRRGVADYMYSCQDRRTKHLHQKFIYRIFYKNAKKAKPKNEICLSDI